MTIRSFAVVYSRNGLDMLQRVLLIEMNSFYRVCVFVYVYVYVFVYAYVCVYVL